MTHGVGTPALWIGFTVFILMMLALDLGVFNRKAHEVGHREALLWTFVWVALAISFNIWIFFTFGRQHGLEFLTGYVIEYSLSIDNLFVILLIFRYFVVPKEAEHRVLFWGILGALVMRALFILVGAVLLQTFHWIIYLFGAFLIFSGIKMLNGEDVEVHPERNPVVRLFRKFVPVTNKYSKAHFVVRNEGRRMATPLMLVLVVVEVTDLIFAVDSIPAIFAVTRDPFIVYTSNIFAILGLRSLYFLLSAAMSRFHYLNFGLGVVLSFVGAEMLLSEYIVVPILISLAVIAMILGIAIIASLLRPPEQGKIAKQKLERGHFPRP